MGFDPTLSKSVSSFLNRVLVLYLGNMPIPKGIEVTTTKDSIIIRAKKEETISQEKE